MEKPVQIKQPIAASFEDFDLVIETFHKAAVMAVDEIVGDLVEMVILISQSAANQAINPDLTTAVVNEGTALTK